MFKEIIKINKNFALVKIDNNLITGDILNIYVVFLDNDKKILGEIASIDDGYVNVSFLGEFTDGRFLEGIIRKPSLNAQIRVINSEELNLLVGNNDDKTMVLGNSALYNTNVFADINEMFSNHMAIFGNTGSGKTYGVARIFQNLFIKENVIPFNANIFIFNSTDEYHDAFSKIGEINPNFNYKTFTTNTRNKDVPTIKIPLWCLTIDDYANLLDVNDYAQLSILEKMLVYVSLFARKDDEAKRYKNHLIAEAIIAVLYTNQTSFRIRDQIFSILSDCYTDSLNLDVEIQGVGYTRQLRKCFDIDSKGDFVERLMVSKYIESFIINDNNIKEEFVPIFFTLKDLEEALNFTLISESLLLNDKHYAQAIELKVKLHSILNSSLAGYFEMDKFITLNQFINNLVLINGNKRCQIINFVLEDIDDRFAKALVKIYSRLFLNFTKSLPNRGMFPMVLMLEEAHRYVQNDIDVKVLGYNIFERIAKEGRKYGVILDLITQRPTELSDNVISQCSNFIIFKINHPSDLEYIEKMVPNISNEIIEKQKSLQSGTCIAFGRMMKLPMIIKMTLPSPAPNSASADIYEKWMYKIK